MEAELESRTLWVTVWHSDMFGRNDFLGELVLPVCRTLFDDSTPHWYTLQERVSSARSHSITPDRYWHTLQKRES